GEQRARFGQALEHAVVAAVAAVGGAEVATGAIEQPERQVELLVAGLAARHVEREAARAKGFVLGTQGVEPLRTLNGFRRGDRHRSSAMGTSTERGSPVGSRRIVETDPLSLRPERRRSARARCGGAAHETPGGGGGGGPEGGGGMPGPYP